MLKVPDQTATEKFILDHSKHANILATDAKTDAETGKTTEAKPPMSLRTMPQSGYLDYMETVHQITPETIKTLTAAEEQLVSGVISVAASDLSTQIVDAKKAGDDPEELSSTVKVARPGGQLKVTVQAQATVPNPKTGERHVKYGVTTVRVRTNTMIDDEAVKRTQSSITALMGG